MRNLWLVAIALEGCGSPNLEPVTQSPSTDSRFDSVAHPIRVEPARPLDLVEPVSAISVDLDERPDSRTLPYVIEGSVSQISLNKLAQGELTSTLSARVVPAAAYATSIGWRLRPRAPLLTGQMYSIVSAYGLHGELTVGPASNQYLARLWPPVSDSVGSLLGIYCGTSAPAEASEIHLDGSDVRARLVPGLDDSGLKLGRCVRLQWGPIEELPVQPPPNFSLYGFDPATIPVGPIPEHPAAVACRNGEAPFGPGCAIGDSGRIIVRPPPGSTLWALGWKSKSHLQIVRDGERFVIPDLGAERSVELSLTVFDAAGRSQSSQEVLQLPAPSPRIIINEVLANPVGSEPAQEWVELFNAGTLDGNLSGMAVNDSEKGEVLPSTTLHPGQYALVVRNDFDVELPGDVPLAGPVVLVRVAQLGHSGLSNSGEVLTLSDSNGSVVSRFPAMAAKTPGFSVARRALWSLDDDPSAFSVHGGEGASPGAANYFDD